MNNFTRMKEFICNQIKDMNKKELFEFISELENTQISTENLFPCKKCIKLYGDTCDEGNINVCFERFSDYCNK